MSRTTVFSGLLLLALLALLGVFFYTQFGQSASGYTARWVEVSPPPESSFVSCQLALFGPVAGAPVGVDCFEEAWVAKTEPSPFRVRWSQVTSPLPNQRCWAALMGLGSGDFVGVVCGR